MTYNHCETQRFLTPGGRSMQYRYGTKDTIDSANIQLKVIPSMFICGVRRTKGNQRYHQPDCYTRIDRASVNFYDNVGILSSASPFSLFQIAKKNGLSYGSSKWSGGNGSLNAPATGTPA